ncbi:Inosine-uridine_nucleoside N-ribohydrolase [Hexamita inflata]|uniref:Inosine-uridine nucleoside N-ribohydrolase n=1 Tax=Hexamita inflata TaxID=28002 RepID=A0AA86RRE1_9EUKA|nr:Inosine-uridine nucleoside N-ribohydrolase [Hexamita inflata]
MKYTWIDTDAGIDDALAILVTLKNTQVLGISLSFGNCPQHMVLRNVTRILSAFLEQHPEYPVPMLCLSAAHSHSKLVKKDCDKADYDCWHGHDGMGDVPDFEASHGKSVCEFQLTDFASSVQKAIDFAKSMKQVLTVLSIGPLTAVKMLLQQNIADYNLITMSCAFPALFPASNSPGNMSSFNQPNSEHNIACDVESAAYVFDNAKQITVVDWNFTLTYYLSQPELQALNSHSTYLSAFHAQISQHLTNKLIEAGNEQYLCCDACAAHFHLIQGNKPFESQKGTVKIITEDGENFGQSVFTKGEGNAEIVVYIQGTNSWKRS